MTDEILSQFGINGKYTLFGNGHINTTYKIDDSYIVQKINTDVFKKPENVMNNIFLVTQQIKNKSLLSGIDPSRKTLEFLHTTDGQQLYIGHEGVFRAYRYIDNAHVISDECKSPDVMYEAAKAIGEFQRLLSDFDVSELTDVIPDFHNTPKRIQNLKASQSRDIAGRVKDVKSELEFVYGLEEFASRIQRAIDSKSVPKRVCHNDTKLNNILFDDITGKALCLIDLDTVMGGSYLYDFGDAVRIGGTYSAEDEKNLDRVKFEPKLFDGFVRGYLESASDVLTNGEKALLFTSVITMTLECGCRFLTDYLDSDVYFRVSYPEHNLVRAKNQFALVRDMQKEQQQAEATVAMYL